MLINLHKFQLENLMKIYSLSYLCVVPTRNIIHLSNAVPFTETMYCFLVSYLPWMQCHLVSKMATLVLFSANSLKLLMHPESRVFCSVASRRA